MTRGGGLDGRLARTWQDLQTEGSGFRQNSGLLIFGLGLET